MADARAADTPARRRQRIERRIQDETSLMHRAARRLVNGDTSAQEEIARHKASIQLWRTRLEEL